MGININFWCVYHHKHLQVQEHENKISHTNSNQNKPDKRPGIAAQTSPLSPVPNLARQHSP